MSILSSLHNFKPPQIPETKKMALQNFTTPHKNLTPPPHKAPIPGTMAIINSAHQNLTHKAPIQLQSFTPVHKAQIPLLPTRDKLRSLAKSGAMAGDNRESFEEEDAEDDSDAVFTKQVVGDIRERGTPYVPVYVMLPLGTINMEGELVDDDLINQLRVLKSMKVDGVMVDCWWGIVEAHTPQQYNWTGYKKLFQAVRDINLKLQVVMSFHECGGNVGDNVHIPIPRWVLEIGNQNADIFFTDREGRRNKECLSWGIDNERVLGGRTALEVYFDFMKNFSLEFEEFFKTGVITEIEVGLGPCGELRYPSYAAKNGWEYPGIGEFQCYDKYLTRSLMKAAEVRGSLDWGEGPHNAGSYNSKPQDTQFFRDGGDYDSFYGRFFLRWYSKVLVDHGDQMLAVAKLAFEDTPIAAKLSGIHWLYKTTSHAAELTAGFHNIFGESGYRPIAEMLKKHGAALNFTCVELRTTDQEANFPEALADPEALVWQVLNAAWETGISFASENALPCYDRRGYEKILDIAIPYGEPNGRHFTAFTYLRLSSCLLEDGNLAEFVRFLKGMHGESDIV
ncbi:Leucine-rich repeat receptor-like serine/threonine-protein kinase bam2 [Castilleja foliolosa]|uniref:Beta-amylase n=1 Tax=Castilleja foliolosa TaxID=1961234 RepID=A0ABD3BYC8_9LAMI